MWIAVGIVLALFAVQSKETAKVGLWFGWCIVVWFVSLGLCGAVLIWRPPQILLAVHPMSGLSLMASLGWPPSLVVLGFLMLAVTCGAGSSRRFGAFGCFAV